MKPLAITEDELHAYVDEALTPARRGEVEAWLAGHPADCARVRAYQAQKQALKALFDPVLDEPLPDVLRSLVVQPLKASAAGSAAVDGEKRPIFEFWLVQRLAAGLLVAALGGVAGWFGHEHFQDNTGLGQLVALPRQAAVAHVVYAPDVRRPVEITADQEEALVKWLSKRLATPVTVPRLGALGYELVGGRLLPGNSGPVAQFMYQAASGQRMTLYLTTEGASQRESGFRFASEGSLNVFYWVDGRFGYALSAAIPKNELAQVATVVYDQLTQK